MKIDINTRAGPVTIPDELDFSALRMKRVNDSLTVEEAPIERICAANKVDVARFRDGPEAESYLSDLIVKWYSEHRRRGGAPDPVEEEIFAIAIAWVSTEKDASPRMATRQ